MSWKIKQLFPDRFQGLDVYYWNGGGSNFGARAEKIIPPPLSVRGKRSDLPDNKQFSIERYSSDLPDNKQFSIERYSLFMKT